MPVKTLTISDPFFVTRVLKNEEAVDIGDKSIVLNLSQTPIRVRHQALGSLQSTVLFNTVIKAVEHAVIIEGFAADDD